MSPYNTSSLSCFFCLALVLASGGSNTVNAEDATTTSLYVEIKTKGDHLIFSPDGKKIVTENSDGTIRLLDAESGKELPTFLKTPLFTA